MTRARPGYPRLARADIVTSLRKGDHVHQQMWERTRRRSCQRPCEDASIAAQQAAAPCILSPHKQPLRGRVSMFLHFNANG